jgi:CRP-like cAMP-binding protein
VDEGSIEIEALRNTPFFADLAEGDLVAISQVGRPASFDAGTKIFEEGDAGDGMYIVLEGSVQVTVGGRFHTLKAGDFFGEMALISSKKRLATVEAVEPLRTLQIPAAAFREFVLDHPSVALSMLGALVERLREVEQRIDAWMAG